LSGPEGKVKRGGPETVLLERNKNNQQESDGRGSKGNHAIHNRRRESAHQRSNEPTTPLKKNAGKGNLQ